MMLYYEISLYDHEILMNYFPELYLYSSPLTDNEITTRTMSTYIERRHCRDNIVSAGMISVMIIPRDRMKIQWK